LKGRRCLFVHAWVNPEKSGVCRNHCLGKCFYTEKACYFQHLHIPIDEYEKLAIGTENYEELEKRVLLRMQELGMNAKGIKKNKKGGGMSPRKDKRSSPRKGRLASGERKETKTKNQSWASCPPLQSRAPERWAEHESGLMTRGLFGQKSRDDLLERLRSVWKVTPIQNETMEESKTDYQSEDEQKEHKDSKETKYDDNVPLATAVSEWTCDDVYMFVKNINNANSDSLKWWSAYAEDLRNDQVDGMTLMEYCDPKALREDYPRMKKGHARMLQSAINKLKIYNGSTSCSSSTTSAGA